MTGREGVGVFTDENKIKAAGSRPQKGHRKVDQMGETAGPHKVQNSGLRQSRGRRNYNSKSHAVYNEMGVVCYVIRARLL